jgi:hypothetical protein
MQHGLRAEFVLLSELPGQIKGSLVPALSEVPSYCQQEGGGSQGVQPLKRIGLGNFLEFS